MAKIESIAKLLSYLKENNVSFDPPNFSKTKLPLNKVGLSLPSDFKQLYENINGTKDYDNNGFLFYQRENLITMGQKFSLDAISAFYDTVIFIDYMQESWWYGVKIEGNGYVIGIIPNKEKFKIITNSLEDFIQLYIEDSDLLYNYS